MRRLLAAVGLLAAISQAGAADLMLPPLRGSSELVPGNPTYLRWSGFYFGGQMGFNTSGFDFSGATRPLVAFSLRELALENEAHPSAWQVLEKSNTTGTSFGGFVGYNSRFEDVVLGVDLTYSRTEFSSAAPLSPISRLVGAGGNTYIATVTGEGSMKINDMASFRGRAAYAFDNFLPYVTIGAVAARVDYTRTATVSGVENPPAGYPAVPCTAIAGCTPFSFTRSEAQQGVFAYGVSLGGGLDTMVLPNVFVRAEYEYVAFWSIADIKTSISTGRLGIGLKF